MTSPTWLTVPDVAEILGVPLRRVRSLIEDRALLTLPIGPDSIRSIPAEFLLGADHPKGPAPMPALRGTILLLADAGLDDEEVVQWLFSEHAELGTSPIAALRDGRTTTVR